MATVAVNLDNAVLEGISKRAATMNLKPGDYVKRLVDAAYAARVGLDRGMPADDAELDAAVRATFALSGDFKPAAIARATGFPAQLVERILEGLRIASRGYSAPSGAGPSGGARDDARPPVGGSAPPEIAARGFAEGPARAGADAPQLGGAEARAAPAGETTPAPPVEPKQPESDAGETELGARNGWPADEVRTIARMWAAGAKARAIADAIGRTEGALSVFAGKNRDICPSRRAS